MTAASVRTPRVWRTALDKRPAARIALASAVGAALIGLTLAVDVPLERAVLSVHASGFFEDLLFTAEMFGHGIGVLLVLVVVANLDPIRRKMVPWLAACAFGGGLAADVVKLLVSRQRPRQLDLVGVNSWDTFTDTLPLLSAGAGGQSFPSAHTATAVGLAVGLTRFYPHGRSLFTALALGVGFQRIFIGAHFLSDVLIGSAIGYLAAHHVLLSHPELGRQSLPEQPGLRIYGEESDARELPERVAA